MPYGILFNNNTGAMTQSILLWQKKYGVLRPAFFLPFSVVVCLISTALSFAFALYIKQIDFIFYTLILEYAVLMFYVSGEAVSLTKKLVSQEHVTMEAVIYDEYMTVKTRFTKDTLYYDEITCCIEKNFILTLIHDKYAMPFSIAKINVTKGSYDEFAEKLKEKLGGKFVQKGIGK